MCRRVLLLVSAALALAASGWAQTEDASEEAVASSGFPLARVLPAVASTPGVGGSFFKTSLQLFNPFGAPITSRLVFHPAGVQGSPADPSMDVTIPPLETAAFDDVVSAMGLSGLGTLDIFLPQASSSPIIVARVFDDAGASGTAGFTEDAISPNEVGDAGRVLSTGNVGHLILPADPSAFRFNIGVRTLSSSVSLQFTVRDASGAFVATVNKLLPSSAFVQSEASSYLGVSLPPNGTIRVSLGGGGAIVYGATIDNTTQDPSIQFARNGS